MGVAGTHDLPIPVILGPTAAGKTAVGIAMAVRVDGEILSADSRAFFAGLDIVTDKPPPAGRVVPHHLIDVVGLCDAYDAMAFRRDVARLIPPIRSRGRVPMIVGGGTVYLGAILRGLFEGPSSDDAFRASVAQECSETLHRRLAAVDPEAAVRIHPHDRLRIVRALEVHALTGRPISVWQADAAPLPHRFFVVGLRRDRDEHRAAIAARVQQMIDRGLIAEVASLRRRGLNPSCQAYRTIGVPEASAVLDGEISEREMRERMVHRTWSLARRQMAWFARENDVSWYDVSGRSAEQVAAEIVTAWREETTAEDVAG